MPKGFSADQLSRYDLTCMRSDVALDVVRRVEAHLAIFALERTLSRVDPHVLNQRVGLRKGRAAERARKRLLLRVRHHVSLQIALRNELGRTLNTLKALHAFMTEKVLLEVAVPTEALPAMRAEILLESVDRLKLKKFHRLNSPSRRCAFSDAASAWLGAKRIYCRFRKCVA